MTLQEFYTGPEKWCQRTGHVGEAKCLRLALMHCYGFGGDLYVGASHRLRSVLKMETGDQIVDWNDADDRTFADVSRVIEAANV